MNARRMLVLAVVMASALSAATQSAAALDVPFVTCSQAAPAGNEGRTNMGWGGVVAFDKISATGGCPEGLSFDTSKTYTKGAWGYWSLRIPGDPHTHGLNFVVEGGDTSTGFRYSYVGPDVVSPYISLPARTDQDGPQTLSYPGLDVLGTITIRVECVETTCAPATPIKVHDFNVTLRDELPPTPRFELNYASWIWVKRQDVRPTAYVTDWPGFGVQWASLAVDDRSAFWSDGSGFACQFVPPGWSIPTLTYSTTCQKPYSAWFNSSIDLRDFKDGQHTISMRAADAAGNMMPQLDVPIKIDDTDPESPDDLTATGLSAGGWLPGEYTTVSWVTPPTDPAVGEQSPMSNAFYELKRVPADGTAPITGDKYLASGGSTFNNIKIPGDGQWDFYVWTTDEVGNRSGKSKIRIKRDRDVPPAPVIAPTPWLMRDQLFELPGRQLGLTMPAMDNIESGICGFAISFNSTENSEPSPTITHPGASPTVMIPGLPAGENWVHARAVSCAGRVSATTTSKLLVDAMPPEVAIGGLPGDGWATASLDLNLVATDANSGTGSPVSGVKSIEYSIDGAPMTRADGGTAHIPVEEGVHTLRYAATDVAGNRSASKTREIKVDATPPHGAFEPHDVSRPTHVEASVEDELSGVTSTQIYYHRIDISDAPWIGLPTASSEDPLNSKRRLLSSVIPDDQMDAGSYELRIVSTDAAGNVGNDDLILDTGVAMRLSLPLRTRSVLTAAIATVAKSKKANPASAKPVKSVKYGAGVALVGELRDNSGMPMAGRKIRIFTAVNNQTRVPLQDTTTDQSGAYQVPIPAGANRRITAQFDATETDLSASGYADLFVSAAAKFQVNRKSVRVGRKLVFSGRVLGGGGDGSPTKIPIVLEFKNGDRWQTGIGRARTGLTGRFSVPYTFRNPTKKAYDLKVRAVVLAESSVFPFQDGVSNPVTVRIRP